MVFPDSGKFIKIVTTSEVIYYCPRNNSNTTSVIYGILTDIPLKDQIT